MKKDEPYEGIKKLLNIFIALIVYYFMLTIPVLASEIEVNGENWEALVDKQSIEFMTEKCDVNVYVEAYSMRLNDVFVGYLTKEEDAELILKAIENSYINKARIDRNNIQCINRKTKLEVEVASARIDHIRPINDVVETIMLLNECKEEPLIEVEIVTFSKELADVEPSTKVVNDSETFLGETTVKEGKLGKKEVVKKNIFINGKYEWHDILYEEILMQPTENIICRGVKNPISSGISFLVHPTRGGVITSNFGIRERGDHKGMDIGVPSGTSIGAACDGVVKYAGYDNIYGNMVIIKHSNEIETAYAHASEILVKTGDDVKKGETIAKVGSTGRSTGPHLHFELRVNGEAVNPKGYIKS